MNSNYNMEDIDLSLCKLIQDLTFGNIESLREMKNGYLLSNLLNKIDPQFFSMSDKFENWMNAKAELERYLSEKGLQNQILDFEEKGIAEGTLEHLVSAVLQVLAIFCAFNEKEWSQLSEQFDSVQKNLLLPIIDPMISDIIEERQQVPKKEEIKTLLLSLESRETALTELGKRSAIREEALSLAYRDIQNLSQENKKLKVELEDLHKLKNETIKQIEEFYANKEDRENEDELSKRLNRTINERDEFADKLFRLQLMLTDRESEIEKLTLIKTAYENKKADLDNFTEQVQYYKTQNSKLKADVDVKDAKLSALEHADLQITKLKDKVKEQVLVISKMRLDKIDSTNQIQTLEKKLTILNDKMDFLRKKNSDSSELVTDLGQDSSYVSKLEEENGNLKKKVSSLIRELSDGDIERMESEMIEKENQLLTGRVKGLLMHSKSLSCHNQQIEPQKRLGNLADAVYKSPEDNCDQKDRSSFTILDLGSASSLMDEKTNQIDNMTLLYSVCMEFLQKDMMKTRVLAPIYDERKRDIFKQFTLANVMKQPNRF